ncbi:phosphate ABC transporter permease subunit PstC [Anaerophaga thermohalophila]|uniref:phosphate ABC transporter permease subunit PstC n=1 Tax=Anaerophaga thermohalophila TaxID=177400 RepID=UPI0003041D1B|nr:phosphate ABC transporter permease subunit PstC [Anaerophaga thermohalophila]
MTSRELRSKITGNWMLSTLALILLFPLLIGVALLIKSIPLLNVDSLTNLLFSANWAPSSGKFGFWPFIFSSLYVTVLSFIFSAPLCLLAAIYLTEFASERLIRIMHPVIDILAGIPSVIYGMWGILVIVPLVGDYLAPMFGKNSSGYSILAGGIVLAIMCIPYMLNMLIETFKSVPYGLKEAGFSLGATHWETIKHIVIRKSRPGIISAFGLGMAKAFGETLAVMMVVGNIARITANPFEAGYPLPALIANNYGEMLSIPLYDSALMFAALVLFVVVLLINIVFRYLIIASNPEKG